MKWIKKTAAVNIHLYSLPVMMKQMDLLIDINECLRDSPKFRQSLLENEKNIEHLEGRLEKAVKNCGIMVESGRQFATSQNHLLVSLWDVAGHFKEPAISASFHQLLHALAEFQKYQGHLVDQAARIISRNLGTMLKTDIRQLKETRQSFEHISGDLDTALTRYAQAPKGRPQELEETANLVQAHRTCFRHTALDYLRAVSLLQSRKQHEVLDTMRSYLQAQVTFSHQCHDLCQDLEPQLKEISSQIDGLRAGTDVLEHQLEGVHSHVTHEDVLQSQRPSPADTGVFMEGYLFKRTTNAFKTWNRRWFTLENHQLKYRRRTGDELTMMEEDLRLCTVKPVHELDRRHCFEVVSPLKSHVMQADSEPSYKLWVEALQAGIGAAFDRPTLRSPTRLTDGGPASSPAPAPVVTRRANVLEQVRRVAGNERCCDCGRAEPTWASINLGVTLCIECSGIHRSLGVQVSKIRSLTLDAWEPEILRVMAELGNAVVNGVYEACPDPAWQRPDADTERSAREAWIRAKYAECRFVRRLPGAPGSGPPPLDDSDESTAGEDDATLDPEAMCDLNPDMLLWKAAAAHNLPVICSALALRADPCWPNSDRAGRTPLHAAVTSGSVMACQHLLLNGSRPDLQDADGLTPLHLAVANDNMGQVCVLLKHKANQRIRDGRGRDPLGIAVENANADIVTLLRVGLLNEEMRDADVGNGDDDTFHQVVKDFSRMAHDAPEKLSRRSGHEQGEPQP
ncbi:arf-GAP with coiled-coil, ANK repeat and PH domain-containing protein 3-like [Pollicipes pollicipes]|uniref:arf-GAP with coiled-coil, ANK repeat and PH domain-containing protein 3-like n=1 Tax=Pollicipes pollicipes TaxID=41117 RepID=UPI001884BF9C|nr:arf-GAP with coiled-coil, ANK repeat and PH domain-containing protein 3-like [Pollicipes pollicipes]